MLDAFHLPHISESFEMTQVVCPLNNLWTRLFTKPILTNWTVEWTIHLGVQKDLYLRFFSHAPLISLFFYIFNVSSGWWSPNISHRFSHCLLCHFPPSPSLRVCKFTELKAWWCKRVFCVLYTLYTIGSTTWNPDRSAKDTFCIFLFNKRKHCEDAFCGMLRWLKHIEAGL